MLDLSPFNTGILLTLIGLAIFILPYLLLRLITLLRSLVKVPPPVPATLHLTPHDEATLLIQSGGRLTFINQKARELFNILDGNPDLESLIRRVHPRDDFLALCSSEGRASLSINGNKIEASSYFAASKENTSLQLEKFMLVTMHQRHASPDLNSYSEDVSAEAENRTSITFKDQPGNQTTQLLTELTLEISSSRVLDDALKNTLEILNQLIPSDLIEISIWDETHQALTPYRLTIITTGEARLEIGHRIYKPFSGTKRLLLHQRKPIIINGFKESGDLISGFDQQNYHYQSYIGIPLFLAGDLIGTLELSSFDKNHYKNNAFDLANLIAVNAAVAINSGKLYQREQARSNELSGLANLAEITSTAQDLEMLIEELTDKITPLIPAKIIGLLLFDESYGGLIGQTPFWGLDDKVVEMYKSVIEPGSDGEQIWQSFEAVVTSNAPEDEKLQALGLHHFARAAGIEQTVMVPLYSSGRKWGYIQAANKVDENMFDHEDIRFLTIFASQAASIIENASLVQSSLLHTHRAETLSRIARLTSSTGSLDEILKFSLLDIARLLHSDCAVIYLLDENRDELRIHRKSVYGISPENLARLVSIPIEDPEYQHNAYKTIDQYLCEDISDVTELHTIFTPLIKILGIHSLINVPLFAYKRIVGELVVGKFKENSFNPSDVRTVATLAGQLASAIYFDRPSSQNDRYLGSRVEQLAALTRIGYELNQSLDQETLLQRTYDEALRITQAQDGSILFFAIDEGPNKNPVIHPGSSIINTKISLTLDNGIEIGFNLTPTEITTLESGKSIVKNSTSGHSIEIRDSSQNTKFSVAHEENFSILVVPIAHRGLIAGLINLYSTEADHFEGSGREICEALGIQAAIAIGNLLRYKEQLNQSKLLERRVDALSNLFNISVVFHKEQSIENSLLAIADAIQLSTPFEIVLISIYARSTQNLMRVSSVGIPLDKMEKLRAKPQPWRAILELLDGGYQLGNCYFIPFEKLSIPPGEMHTMTFFPQVNQGWDVYQWHPDDLLLLPLFDQKGDPLGLISVDAPRNNLRPDFTTLEVIEIFGKQAAILIETHQKITNLRTRLIEVEDELITAKQAATHTQNLLPSLLHKDLEQTTTIRKLNQRYTHILAGLDLASQVAKQKSRSELLIIIGEYLLSKMNFDIVLIAEQIDGDLSLVSKLGSIPPGVNPIVYLGQNNPIRHCLSHGEMLLVSKFDHDSSTWESSPLLRALETKSFICIPVDSSTVVHNSHSDESTQAVLLAVNQSGKMDFTDDDHQLFGLLAHQTAIALRNIHLLEETTNQIVELDLLIDFSQQVSSLDPDQIYQTLIKNSLRLIPAAERAMIAIWDTGKEKLVPRAADGYSNNKGILKVEYQIGEGLPGQIFEKRQALRLDEIKFPEHFNLSPENLMYHRNATYGQLPVSSLVVPLMAIAANGSERCLEKNSQAPPLGVLVLDNTKRSSAFTEEDLAMITSLANQTGLALENARLFQATEKRTKQLQALAEVSATITSSLQAEELIEGLLEQLHQTLRYDTGTLWMQVEDQLPDKLTNTTNRMIIRTVRGLEDNDQRQGLIVDVQQSRILNEIVNKGTPISVANIYEDERFSSATTVIDDEETNPNPIASYSRLSWLGVPLIISGNVIGVIVLEKKEPNFYNEGDIQVATTFAGQVSIALENAKLFQETRSLTDDLEQRVSKRTAELENEQYRAETLLRIISELSSSLDIDYVLNKTLQVLGEFVKAAQITILITRPGENKLYRLASSGYMPKPETGGQPTQIDVDKGLAGWIINKKQSVLVNDLSKDKRWIQVEYPEIQDEERYIHRSVLGVPILRGTDAVGTLMLFHTEVNHFTFDQLQLVEAATKQVAIAINNAELYQLIRDQAENLKNLLRSQKIETSRSKAILEAVADGVLVTDEDNQITLFNLSAEKILGLERSKVLGKSLAQFCGIFGKTTKNWIDTIHSWSQMPENIDLGNTYVEHINLEDERVISIHLAPICMQDEFLGTVSIFQDITHQVEVDRLKSEFVGTVSHELRTPMTSIQGYVEVLLSGAGGPLNKQQTEFLEIVKANTERLTILVNDLLDISQIEAGKSTLSFQPIDLEEAADQAITNIKRCAIDEKIQVQIIKEYQPGLPHVFADPDRLLQIFENILDNAVKYNSPNGKIFVKTNQVDGEVQVDIQDTGLGIPPEDHHRIGERFHRGENPLVTGVSGTGLGLSIVNNLIRMHSGRFWFESSGIPGEGCTFSFTIPVYSRMKDKTTAQDSKIHDSK